MLCEAFAEHTVCWNVEVNSIDANFVKGSDPWSWIYLLAVVFSLSSCTLLAGAVRETRDVLRQMDLSLIFGICNVLIIFLFCLGNKTQPNHPLWLYCRFKTDVLINCFQSPGWVKSRQDNYGGGILELGNSKERKESMYMWVTYMSVRGCKCPLLSLIVCVSSAWANEFLWLKKSPSTACLCMFSCPWGNDLIHSGS